jgi:hypothetical protein
MLIMTDTARRFRSRIETIVHPNLIGMVERAKFAPDLSTMVIVTLTAIEAGLNDVWPRRFDNRAINGHPIPRATQFPLLPGKDLSFSIKIDRPEVSERTCQGSPIQLTGLRFQ